MTSNHKTRSNGNDPEPTYFLTRDAKETARLNWQHQVFTKHIGFLIHPSIPNSSPNLKIADIGTGTGVWLLDVAKSLPQTCTLSGFDLSAYQFPAASALPSNVKLYEQNVLYPFPQEHLGIYDIVAVRLLSIVLVGREWESAVQNVSTLLKPGGYLQWVYATFLFEEYSPIGLTQQLRFRLRRKVPERIPPETASYAYFNSKDIPNRKYMLTQRCRSDGDFGPEAYRCVSDHNPSYLRQALQATLDWKERIGRDCAGPARLVNIFQKNEDLEAVEGALVPTDRTLESAELFTGTTGPCTVELGLRKGLGMSQDEADEFEKRMVEERKGGKNHVRFDIHIAVGRKKGAFW